MHSFHRNRLVKEVFQLIENYSKILRNDSDSQTFAIIVEHICRSTKIDVRNQEFDIDELTSEKGRLHTVEIRQV